MPPPTPPTPRLPMKAKKTVRKLRREKGRAPQSSSDVGDADKSAQQRNEEKALKSWAQRLRCANTVYETWDKRFHVGDLYNCYAGEQWPRELRTGSLYQDPYVMNRIHPTIRTKIPSYMFYNPKARVTGKPMRADDIAETVDARAKLREDIADSYITDPAFEFKHTTYMAIFEAFFSFGVVEIGYNANFANNPNAGKPMLKKDGEEMKGADGETVYQGKEGEKTEESLYIRRIPSNTVRVPEYAGSILEREDWVAYFEWQYTADVKRNKYYRNVDLKTSGRLRQEYGGGGDTPSDANDAEYTRKGMVKVWKVWDLRAREHFVFAQGCGQFLVKPEPYEIFPLVDLQFDWPLEGYYGVPLVSQWLSPQFEYNESREMERVHRRRMYRRYQTLKDAVDPDELDKMQNGGDGVVVVTKVPGAIQPIADAPLDPAVSRNLLVSAADFDRVAGVGANQAGANSPGSTATEANIVDTRARIIEDFERERVARFLSRIIGKMLEFCEEYMTLDRWILRTVDPAGQAAEQNAQQVAKTWQLIKMVDELDDDLSYDVDVDVESLSPVTEETRRQNWQNVLAALANPALQSLFSASETILRKTLGFYGIRSEKEIAEIKQALLQMQLQAAAMAMAAAGAKPGGAAGGVPGEAGRLGSGTTPDPTAIAGQLGQQM